MFLAQGAKSITEMTSPEDRRADGTYGLAPESQARIFGLNAVELYGLPEPS